MNIAVVLCEGPHDVSFLERLLKTTGLKVYDKELQKLPPPLDDYITERFKNYKYDNLTIETLRPPLPSIILKNDETYVLLFALGGKKNLKKKAEEIISDFNSLKPETGEPGELDWGEKHTLSFVIILDANGTSNANETGLENTVKSIRDFFPGFFKKMGMEIDKKKIDHGNIEKLRHDISIGCFIITSDGKNGRLEDIILPLMEKGNEKIFQGARSYFSDCCDKKSVDKDKAVIGIAGQLRKAGCSNNVIIRQSKYITVDKIKNDEKCREIVHFFNRLLNLN